MPEWSREAAAVWKLSLRTLRLAGSVPLTLLPIGSIGALALAVVRVLRLPDEVIERPMLPRSSQLSLPVAAPKRTARMRATRVRRSRVEKRASPARSVSGIVQT